MSSSICPRRKLASSTSSFNTASLPASGPCVTRARITDANRERIGVAMGSGIGGLTNIENSCKALIEQGPRRISPFFVPGSIINMVSGFPSIHPGLQGPNYAIATACTTGTHCIGMAARNIAYGEADVMVAGGSEMAACGLGIGGFAAARALSTRNDDPAAASRPRQGARRFLCCPMVPVRWCSRSSSMPRRVAPASMPS